MYLFLVPKGMVNVLQRIGKEINNLNWMQFLLGKYSAYQLILPKFLIVADFEFVNQINCGFPRL